MKVRCVSCGKDIEVRTRFDKCPSCKRPAFKILKDLIDHSQEHRQAWAPEEDLDPNPLDDLAHGPVEEAAPYVPAQRGSDIEKKIAKIVFITIASIIGLVILVDYIRTKAVQIYDRHHQQTSVAPAPLANPAPAVPPEPPPEPVPSPSDQAAIPKAGAVTRAASRPMATVMFHPVPAEKSKTKQQEVTDAAIRAAIEKGITFLLTRFDGTGRLKSDEGGAESHDGRDALCVLALLHAGESTQDSRLGVSGRLVTEMLDQLKKLKMENTTATYAHSLRIGALAVHNRAADRDVIRNDVAYLLKSAYKGAFTYYLDANRKPDTPIDWDNSNTQYGQMGVWLASDAGVIAPATFWTDVQKHWLDCQDDDGGFSYKSKGNSSLAMTCAGLTMMLVADEQLYGDSWASTTRPKPATEIHDAIQKATEWVGTGDNCLNISGHFGYILYGLERAGLASGFRFLGKHDWYSELGAVVLNRQQPDGHWDGGYEGPAADTAFALLFLSRGRHPVLMNKLMFDGTWANRPRDAAHLAKFTAHELERPLNWQVVGIDYPWESWTDCPILYIASHEAPQFNDEQIAKLRSYALSGGMLFTHADNNTESFNAFAHDLAKKIFPQYPLQPLPPNHLIYSVGFPVATKFPLEAVSNGTRLLMINSPTDISKMWQRRDENAFLPAFRLGANLFVYATGKEAPQQRLDLSAIDEPAGKPLGTIPIARLKYAGDWDPEPSAWERLGRIFRNDTSIALSVHPLDVGVVSAADARLAHLTGTVAISLDDKQLANLRQYVEDGGVLLIDSCGGSKAFTESIRETLAKAFTEQPLAIEPTHPILAGTGESMVDCRKPTLRSFAVVGSRDNPPQLQMIKQGKGCVIFSDYDLTCGWLGTRVWGILGYDPDYAQKLAKNLILWTVNGRNAEADATQ